MTKEKETQGLTKIDMTGVKYPLKEIFMRFLEHTDSAEQQISDEITLRFPPTLESGSASKNEVLISTLCPTTFTIHETFPILLLQDGTHFCSFTLTKELYDKLKLTQIKDQCFSEMAQYSVQIKKVRVQILKNQNKDHFAKYNGLEVRLIITDAEIISQGMSQGTMDQRKNWWMKSVYQDEDIRTIFMAKYYQRMTDWIEKEPEFEEWPTGPIYFEKDKTIKYDKKYAVLVQPEVNSTTGETNRPKPDNSRDLFFECFEEKYEKDCGFEPYDCEDVIVIEKGKEKYDEMVKNRLEAINRRKANINSFNTDQLVMRHSFNTEDERKKTQERQQQRQCRNEIKEMAEQAKISHFQISSLQKHFTKLSEIPEKQKQEIITRSRRAGNPPVPSKLHLNHTKRYIQWFRENVIMDPSASKNLIEKNKDENIQEVKTDFSDYFPKGHDFGITIIQRCGSIMNGYSFSGHTSQNLRDSSSNPNIVKSQQAQQAAPEQLFRKRQEVPQVPSQTMKPSQSDKKFTIGEKKNAIQTKKPEEKKSQPPPSDSVSEAEKAGKELKEESKALKSEEEEDSEVSKKKPAAAEKPALKMGGSAKPGIASLGKRKPMGGGLMGSLSKKSKT